MTAGLKELKKEIKRQYRRIKKGKQDDYNFLGFVEDKDLTSEVENLFKAGDTYYNWVSGTKKMEVLIKELGGEISGAERLKLLLKKVGE